MVLGTWFSVLGTRYLVLGIWCSVLGTQYSISAPGTRYPVLDTHYSVLRVPDIGTLYLVLGTWYSLGTRYFVIGTWYSVLGTRYLVLGTWYLVLGTRYSVLGTWYSVLGIWCSVLGTQYSISAPGTRYPVLDTPLLGTQGTRYLALGTWYSVLGTWYLVLATWYSLPGIQYPVLTVWLARCLWKLLRYLKNWPAHLAPVRLLLRQPRRVVHVDVALVGRLVLVPAGGRGCQRLYTDDVRGWRILGRGGTSRQSINAVKNSIGRPLFFFWGGGQNRPLRLFGEA